MVDCDLGLHLHKIPAILLGASLKLAVANVLQRHAHELDLPGCRASELGGCAVGIVGPSRACAFLKAWRPAMRASDKNARYVLWPAGVDISGKPKAHGSHAWTLVGTML